jgi:hypothetical protein
MGAWGRNASFQLACVHMLGEALLAASEVLGEKPQPIWKEILQKLPKACLMDYAGAKATVIPGQGRVMIGLWEGKNLEESHRHHSHLGAIVPFDAIDPADPQWKDVVEASVAHWIYRGMGLWSGWCMPWASMIHSHLGNADMAELTLEIWQRVFTNERHGTLHDAGIAGFSLIGCRATKPRVSSEIMQMDAGMSCVTAIMEMLLNSRRGIHYLFAGAPARWEEVSFEGIRTEGAFLVSAARAGGEVGKVKLESLAGGTFRLANPWNAPASARSGRKSWKLVGPVLDIAAEKGETIELTKA